MSQEFEYRRCTDCGSIHDKDDVPTARDPFGSDEILSYCPDCEAVEDFESVKIHVMHDQTANAWLAYFVNRDESKVSPFKSGRSEEEAREALLASISY